MTIEELRAKAEENGIVIDDAMAAQLRRYAELIGEWNEKINLTTITDPEEIMEKHFHDSILPLTGDVCGKAADVGSGAGFPGMVWKIVRPDLHVTLIEPTGKRCTFLKEVIRELGLQDIEVINERAEEHVKNFREIYDVVSARAVANLRILSELCIPLVRTGGIFIAMKGMKGREEAEEAKNAVKLLGAELLEIRETSLTAGDTRINLYYRKTKNTPAKYPRNYGQIRKKPL